MAPDSEPHDEQGTEEDAEKVSKEDFLKNFFKTFKAEEQGIKQELAAVVAAGGGDKVHDALDALLVRVQALEASFTRQAHLLPAYDVQQYRSAVKAIAGDIASKREQLAPRKKFSFKRRAAPSAPSAVATVAGTDASASSTGGYGSSTAAAPGPAPAAAAAYDGELFEGLTGELVVRGPGELQGRDVSLRNLEGCRIVLLDRIGALHVHSLRRCEIVIGAVSSSALMHHCHECVFTLAVKQLRLHDSENVVFHLHTLSGPIIEHCRRILFAPLDLSWPGGEEQLTSASLGKASADAGPWSDVQDFNWLKRQASPNWCQVPRGQRREASQFASASEALDKFGKEALPPALPELEQYHSCWEATDAPQSQAAPAAVPEATPVAVPETAPAAVPEATDAGAHDDEF